jgi:multicomponent Na+:H+ antiporter subunit D
VLIIAISLLSAFTIFLAGWINRKSCCFISIATIAFQFILSIFILRHVLTVGTIRYWLGGWRPPWGIEYVVDALNAFILVVILFLSLLVAIYSKRNVEHEIEGKKLVTFYSIFQLLVTGLCGITVTGDMFNLYVFLEIASIAAYALIAVAGGRALKASYNYLIMGSLGACFYLIGVGFLYSVTGTLNMGDLRILLPPLYANRAVQAAFVFFVIGVSIKAYVFPLHTWQPDAYTYAPSTVSALIASTMSKVMIYALIRLIYSVFTLNFILSYVGLDIVICWVAAIAIIAGSIFAITQRNLKRMLAYSSVSQIGYIILGVGLSPLSVWGLYGAVAHILNHAIMKGCLFLAAGAFIHKAGLWDIRDFEGLGKKMPYASAAFTIAAISMIGIPPGAGFASKLFLILASLEASQYPFVAILLLSTLLNLVYFWRVIDRMYFVGHEEATDGGESEGGLPLSMLVPMLILAALCIILGIFWLTELPLPLFYEILSDLGAGVKL